MGTKVFNSEVITGLRANAGTMGIDAIPSELADKIVPTMETNPELLRKTNIIKSGNGLTTSFIYTTLTDRDTYLTGVNISASSLTIGANKVTFNITPDGENSAVTVCAVCIQVGAGAADPAAGHNSNSQTFANPIKIKRGTNFAFTVTGTIAANQISATGYTIENIKI